MVSVGQLERAIIIRRVFFASRDKNTVSVSIVDARVCAMREKPTRVYASPCVCEYDVRWAEWGRIDGSLTRGYGSATGGAPLGVHFRR